MSFKVSLLALSFFTASSVLASPLSIDCVLRGSCISGQDVMEHLRSLYEVAEGNKGNRSAGSKGHELSGNFIAQKLLAAGYKVELQPFSFSKFEKLSAALSLAAPEEREFQEEHDFNVMAYSGSGSVSSRVSAVDLSLGAGNNSTSGCEEADFAGFTAGDVALIQRGTCPFVDKVRNAQAAGASAVVIFNQGNSTDREAVFSGTVSESEKITIPVLAASYQLALDLLALENPVLTVIAKTKVETKTSFNVIAETKSGDPANVVMIGAHLDSVAEGPGINDNGSGSAAVLEVALNMKDLTLKNKVRFAWFSAEELGLIGSTKYVEALSEAEKSKISLYLNVDMVASPNYMIGVYDGDGSKFGQKGPEGSSAMEQLLHGFFASVGVPSVETELNGRSDYAAFSAAGIAVGGVFTGAEGKKTEEEARLFGGKAGEAYDVCYHKACDDLANVNETALEVNTNAIAFVALSYANSTETVRPVQKNATMMKKRKKVVFPKHHSCNGDVHGE